MKAIIATIFIVLTISSLKADDSAPANGTESKLDLDDRINLNLNYGAANAYRPGGGVSSSNTLSYGVNAGLLYQNGQYQSLGSKTQSQAHTYSNGYRPPHTYANSGVNSRGPYLQGNAGAGFSGGYGNAFTGSHSDRIAIPLGLGGPVLLSNLQPINETQKSNGTDARKAVEAPTTANEKDGELLFRPREDLKPKSRS